jgi:hypothetical protein
MRQGAIAMPNYSFAGYNDRGIPRYEKRSPLSRLFREIKTVFTQAIQDIREILTDDILYAFA